MAMRYSERILKTHIPDSIRSFQSIPRSEYPYMAPTSQMFPPLKLKSRYVNVSMVNLYHQAFN